MPGGATEDKLGSAAQDHVVRARCHAFLAAHSGGRSVGAAQSAHSSSFSRLNSTPRYALDSGSSQVRSITVPSNVEGYGEEGAHGRRGSPRGEHLADHMVVWDAIQVEGRVLRADRDGLVVGWGGRVGEQRHT